MKKTRITPIVIAVGAVLAAAARVFAVSRIDMTVGTLFHDTSLLCNILYYGIVALTAAAAMISSHIDGKRGACGTVDIKPGAVSTIAVGFCLLAVAICAGYDGIGETKALTPTSFLVMVDMIFAAVLCIIAFVTLYMKEFKPGLGFSFIFGGLYYVCRGISCFMSRMAITTVPEYLAECLTTICGAVFFVIFARLFSGNGGKLTIKAFFAWGTATFVMAASTYLGAAASKLLLPSEISERIVFSANEAEIYFQTLHGIDAYKMAFPPLPIAALGVFAAAAMLIVSFSESQKDTIDTVE